MFAFRMNKIFKVITSKWKNFIAVKCRVEKAKAFSHIHPSNTRQFEWMSKHMPLEYENSEDEVSLRQAVKRCRSGLHKSFNTYIEK